ncbi:hypothetical protein J4P91_05495 [Bacillus sp. XF8]|nr:hypothetical protein [Bacillus sp. XF8]
MYQNRPKQQKEETVDGVLYQTHWRGEEVCAIWEDVKQKRMEQCRHV